MLIVFLVVALLIQPAAVGAAGNASDEIANFLKDWSTIRETQVRGGTNAGLGKYYDRDSAALIRFEEQRTGRFRAMEAKLGIKIVGAKTTTYIRSLSTEPGRASVQSYEWTFFDWLDENGNLNVSGMGVDHDIVLAKTINGWRIVSDAYDDGPLTNGTSPDFRSVNAQGFSPTDLDQSVEFPVVPQSEPGATYYNRNAAANYSDDYVYPQAYRGYYPDYYNWHYYKNYKEWGGDCANFVSQSLRAGGAYFVGFGTGRDTSTSVWWYNDKGTYPDQTGDDDSSQTWRYVPWHRAFILAGWGSVTTESGLLRGDVVYYDWADDTAGWQHTTIVAAFDTTGKALVNSHTYDYYHVRWNYGGSGCIYSLVHMKDWI